MRRTQQTSDAVDWRRSTQSTQLAVHVGMCQPVDGVDYKVPRRIFHAIIKRRVNDAESRCVECKEPCREHLRPVWVLTGHISGCKSAILVGHVFGGVGHAVDVLHTPPTSRSTISYSSGFDSNFHLSDTCHYLQHPVYGFGSACAGKLCSKLVALK